MLYVLKKCQDNIILYFTSEYINYILNKLTAISSVFLLLILLLSECSNNNPFKWKCTKVVYCGQWNITVTVMIHVRTLLLQLWSLWEQYCYNYDPWENITVTVMIPVRTLLLQLWALWEHYCYSYDPCENIIVAVMIPVRT